MKNLCTCPAAVDITFTGHLPDCPEGAYSKRRTRKKTSTKYGFGICADEKPTDRTCVYCGCTDSSACKGGCGWLVRHKFTRTGICSSCCTVEHIAQGDLILIPKRILRKRVKTQDH